MEQVWKEEVNVAGSFLSPFSFSFCHFVIFISLLFFYFKLAGLGSNTHAILMIFMDQKNMISMATAPGFEQISALKVLFYLFNFFNFFWGGCILCFFD